MNILRKLEPKTLKSKVLENLELKVVISKVLRASKVKVKTYPRKIINGQKAYNESKPYYKAKAQSKRKPYKIHLRGSIQVWVPNNEIVFAAYILKGKNKATPAPGQGVAYNL